MARIKRRPQTARRAHGFHLGLDNFNYGMTRVVLVKLRCRDGARAPSPLRVRLAYDDAGSEKRARLVATTSLAESAPGVTDHEVRKNFTIAVMARALRRMAQAAEGSRFGEADRYLRAALDYANRQYPATNDADLVNVRRMLEKYQKVLGSRIEVYRDL